jgi:hypothetical protein
MPQHPAELAESWVISFSKQPLSDTLYAKQLSRPLSDLAKLHKQPMPWKVRLSVLVYGVIPKSYLEDLE